MVWYVAPVNIVTIDACVENNAGIPCGTENLYIKTLYSQFNSKCDSTSRN